MRSLLLIVCLASRLVASPLQADTEALAQKAVDAERRGDFRTAVSAFQELLRSGADSAELRSNLGIAYYQLRDFSAALREFRVTLSKTPDSIPANLFSGLSLVKLDRPKEALPYLERAHRARPEAAEIVLALAQAEVAANDILQSRASYQQATQLDPQSAEAWYGLGITNRVLAEQQVERSKHSAQAGAAAVNSSAKARALMNASEESLAKAMQLDPNSVHARMILGESFRIAERYEDAVRQYQSATEQQPDLAPAWVGLAVAYSASGDNEKALTAAFRALALDPNDAETNAVIAGALVRQGEYDKAKPYATRALELQPDLASAHVVRAKIYLAQQQPAKALPDLEAAVKDDIDGSTYYLLGTTLRQVGKQAEAAAAIQKYKQLHSTHRAAGPNHQ